MKRRHHMPFGTEILDDGRVRFRLWAPGARKVDLCLRGRAPEARLPMVQEDAGWFGIITEMAASGTVYCYRIDDELDVPDPASRCQLMNIHGPSQIVDPERWEWTDRGWRGRLFEEAVIYEIHVGSFTAAGSFSGVKERLDHLVELGVTAIELMPVADFPGRRSWGYDGVLPFAPDRAYGHPDDLKDLIQEAHGRELMVFLDVVYNHFGPEGNYLYRYAPAFFTDRHHTPWGKAVNFDDAGSRMVRDFFIHNALYWIREYHADGLRLDAVHAIADDSVPDILEELAAAVREEAGREDRHVHLVLENDHNAAHYLVRGRKAHYDAQWNDDLHHALHVLITGECDGYYADHADRPLWYLGRCLAEGFAYQGEPSSFRDRRPRGEPSLHLPPTAFVSFLQNHDQIGNRAFGERLATLAPPEALRAAVAIVLLAPSPPLLFMGEEFGAPSPFLFFCDFPPELAAQVRAGRQGEFAHNEAFRTPEAQARIPDPNAMQTFQRSQLDWNLLERPPHRDWLALYRKLLQLRAREITPRLSGIAGACASFELLGDQGLRVWWRLGDGSSLTLQCNLGPEPLCGVRWPPGAVLYAIGAQASPTAEELGPWSVVWTLTPAR